MVLVDTSVWVSHLRARNSRLVSLLEEAEVACHPFVIGELACGNINNRRNILALLQALPVTPVITQDEFLHFVQAHKLSGKGLGFVDVHLLASARLARMPVWTEDGKLNASAQQLDLSHD
jgi:predicted nucleic acid-binding protein